MLSACSSVPSIQDSVEIRRGESVQEKLQIASAIVNEQTLGRMRVEARRRVPDAADDELRRVSLVVTKTASRASRRRPQTIRISVIVSLREPSPERGPKILKTCVQLVDEAISGNATWLDGRR
jgi:hypothetical protein